MHFYYGEHEIEHPMKGNKGAQRFFFIPEVQYFIKADFFSNPLLLPIEPPDR